MSNLQNAYEHDLENFENHQEPNQEDYDFGFNPAEAEDAVAGTYELLPVDAYRLMAISIELKFTAAGNRMVAARFAVTEGKYEGRLIFENFNLENQNEKTVLIARSQIKSWIAACGSGYPESLAMRHLRCLEGCEFRARVTVQRSRDRRYGDQNRIGHYLPAEELSKVPFKEIHKEPQKENPKVPSRTADKESAQFSEKARNWRR